MFPLSFQNVHIFDTTTRGGFADNLLRNFPVSSDSVNRLDDVLEPIYRSGHVPFGDVQLSESDSWKCSDKVISLREYGESHLILSTLSYTKY